MPTVVLDPAPHEIELLRERRARLGQDRRDEMWEGVLHMVPAPGHRHSVVAATVKSALRSPASAAGLTISDEFNLGDSEHDYRVPDGGLHRPGAAEMWHPTAALVIEIVSPNDETDAKLPFYAAHHVDEVLIVDPAQHSVRWLALADGGGYRQVQGSTLIDLSAAELADQIDWP